jgi:hypothetical protein
VLIVCLVLRAETCNGVSSKDMTQNSITKVKSLKHFISTLRERYASASSAIGSILRRSETAVRSASAVLDAKFAIASTHSGPSRNILLPFLDYAHERRIAIETGTAPA